jgi:mannose-6-phosphate isomerase-like protein (cupin superfamily)
LCLLGGSSVKWLAYSWLGPERRVSNTVSEFWHVLSGEGRIWRRDESGEETTVLEPGVSIDIPVGTALQHRCTGVDPLEFLCVSMPRWPGDLEATLIEGPWAPTAP